MNFGNKLKFKPLPQGIAQSFHICFAQFPNALGYEILMYGVPRFAADITCSPAALQSAKTKSPDNKESVLLVSGRTKISLEICGALMMTAGLIWEVEKSENG